MQFLSKNFLWMHFHQGEIYDMTSVSSSALVSRKRRELEAIIDTSLNAVFVKQLQVLRENALSQFKASLSSEEVRFRMF